MSLKVKIHEAMKSAMREKQKARLSTIRLMLADINRVEVDERTELPDDRILVILDKMQKQRRDSISQYEQAGRDDLAAVESYELGVISDFLPEPLSEEALVVIIDNAISEVGATSMGDMGKVMALVKPQAQGRANMSEISKAVKSRLG
jgi:uncharacterized protein YqeY